MSARQQARQCLQGQKISVAAEPRDHADRSRTDIGVMTEAFTLVDIGNMDLYHRQLGGEVRLRSQDPGIDPVVEFNMLSDERDLVRLRDCVRRMISVVRHRAVSSVSDGVLALATPIDDLDSDDAIDAWLAENVDDYVHATGTCRMGTPGDPAAVVDTDCRVIGYQRLRVCDASVMPDLPKANTNLTTLAIADQLATKMLAPATTGAAEAVDKISRSAAQARVEQGRQAIRLDEASRRHP